MNKQVIRINENQLKQIVMESVKRVLKEEKEGQENQEHFYTEKEMKWLYDNQDKLTPIEEKVLNAGMWVRAMKANYNGYSERWPNIAVIDGEVYFYNKNGNLERIPQFAN